MTGVQKQNLVPYVSSPLMRCPFALEVFPDGQQRFSGMSLLCSGSNPFQVRGGLHLGRSVGVILPLTKLRVLKHLLNAFKHSRLEVRHINAWGVASFLSSHYPPRNLALPIKFICCFHQTRSNYIKGKEEDDG